jgi:hypothetical protein
MRLVRINTTEYFSEDFYLLTTLDDTQISEVIQPIINAERDGYEDYTNEGLFRALTDRFPNDKIDMFHELDRLNL